MYNAVQKELKEINSFPRQNILNQHQSKSGVFALNNIFQEHILRYVMLKNFYEDLGQNIDVKYETEVKTELGPIDLVFYKDPNKFAFEIKRWQDGSSRKRMITRDIKKLDNFRNNNKNTYCYELIFTGDKPRKSEENFREDFKDFAETQLKLLYCKSVDSDDFTVCIYLAELK